jgi:hypothetical protein
MKKTGKYRIRKKIREKWEGHRILLAKWYVDRATKGIRKMMSGLGQEADETKRMAVSFFKMLEHKLNLHNRTDPPTKEEVKEAIEQLKDVGRLSVFISAVILPFGVFSLLGLELLARKFGIRFSFIPSSFKNKKGHPAEKKESSSGEPTT